MVFSPGLLGASPLSYQWQFYGTNLPAATNRSLVIASASLSDAGMYTLVVTNLSGQALVGASLTVNPVTCLPAPSGLVAWWQGEGDASDALGTNNGQFHTGVTFVPGEVGEAFAFDGAAGYVSIPATSSLDVGTNSGLTFECWLNPAELSTSHCLAEWNNGAVGVGFWLSQPVANSGGGPGCLFANLVDTLGTSHLITTPQAALVLNALQHAAFTYDKASGVAMIYVDGVPLASQFLGTFTPRTSYNLYLGKRQSANPNGFYQGLMDEAAVYNRALSGEEILAVYNARWAGRCPVAPAFTAQPKSLAVVSGQSAGFSASMAGTRPLLYQWQLNGTNLPGATLASLTIASTHPSDAGAYSLGLSNLAGVAKSSNAVLTVSVPACFPPPTNLAGCWQGEGDASDSTGLSPGQFQGTAAFALGEVGSGFSFDGVANYVSIPATAALNVGTNSGLTIEFWMNPADITNPHDLVEWNNGTGVLGSHCWLSQPTVSSGGGPGCLFANLIDSSGTYHTFSTAGGIVTTGLFQHIALTYDKSSGLATFYYNGAVVAAGSVGVFTPRTSLNLYLGARPSGGVQGVFKGVMDEVSLYKRALSATEILGIYNAAYLGKCGSAPALVAQPAGWTNFPGATVTLSAGVSGARPLACGWYLNGALMPGATTSSLTLTNIQPVNAGRYSFGATNALGFAVSANATVRVKVVSLYGNSQPLTNGQYAFGNSVSLQMTNYYANGVIFYTLDGTAPNFGSSIYSGAFAVSNSCVVRALGFTPDFMQSAEADPVSIVILPTYTLTGSSSGGGTISVSPTNNQPFLANATVTVWAVPASGWTFLRWLGDAAGTNTTNSVLMSRNKSLQAVFGTTLQTTVAGGGSVLLNPGGGLYPFGTSVQLIGVPQTGYSLLLWGNAASGNQNPLTFFITNANPTVSSLFTALGTGQFALAAVPVGRGKVSLNPQANAYASGANVTLTALPAPGQTFLNWSGDASGSSNPLSVSMSRSRTIYANFTHNFNLAFQVLPLGFTEGVQLTLTGDLGSAYRLDTSSNLHDWVLGPSVTNNVGTLQFIDPTAASAPQRFYRGEQTSP